MKAERTPGPQKAQKAPTYMRRSFVVLAVIASACSEEAPTDRLRVSGHVEATETRLAPEVGGRILTLTVKEGDRVQPGQVVGNTGDSIAPYNCTRNPHLHLEIRKQGRGIATNPTPYFDVNWDDATLGVYPGPRFERNLDDPKRHQFLDEQPDIAFGGPVITNFARPWPP